MASVACQPKQARLLSRFAGGLKMLFVPLLAANAACGGAPSASAGAVEVSVDAGPPSKLENVALPLAVSGNTACFVREGKVWCWGSNLDGKLGRETEAIPESARAVVSGLPASSVPLEVDLPAPAKQIAGSAFILCAIAGGELYCWGRSERGELGFTAHRVKPTKIAGIKDAVKVATGWRHLCVLTDNGTVYCLGNNSSGVVAPEDERRSILGAEHGRNPVDYVIAQVGGNTGFGLSGADTKDPDLLGGIAIELIDADLRPYTAFAFVADIQDAVRQHPLAETVSFRGWRSGPGGDSLSVELFGADAETLKAAAEALKTALAQYPEVSALQDSLAYDKEELILELTPQGQTLGFSTDALGRVLRNRLGGIEAATYPDGPRSAAIRVELPEGELTADFLDRSLMRTQAGDYVPLADIVTVTTRSGFSTVRRENGNTAGIRHGRLIRR